MKLSDYDRFVDILSGVFEVYGKERSDTAVALWWKVVEGFSLPAVENALAEHVRTSRFAPTPADVVGLLQARDGRPTADEAWAMIPRTEHESVGWTDEMAAAYGVASPLLGLGDQVAARRAFIDKYTFEVNEARRKGRAPKVWFSWGWDAAGRQSAVDRAVNAGFLTEERAVAFLPAPMREERMQQIESLAERLKIK